MNIGTLAFRPIEVNDSLVASTVSLGVFDNAIADDVFVAAVDPEFSDTSVFCEHYRVEPGAATNCLVVEARRGEKIWYSVCLILASDSADVNGVIRKKLGARKVSFAPKDVALELTGMEYGGITPIGLPTDWDSYIDESIMNQEFIVIGGGVRGSKVAIRPMALLELPNVQVLDIKRT